MASNASEVEMEIERKWLLTHAQAIPLLQSALTMTTISQGYLVSNKEITVRIRMELLRGLGQPNPKFTLTIKRGTGMSRAESNDDLGPEEGLAALQACPRGLMKERFNLPGDRFTLDWLKVDGKDMFLVEKEFDTVELATAYVPTFEFVNDVTEDEKYTNANLTKTNWL